MKKTIIFFSVLLLSNMLIADEEAEISNKPNKFAFGFTIGKPAIYTKTYNFFNYYYYRPSQIIYPTVLSIMFYRPLSNGLHLQLGCGFAFANNMVEYEQDSQTFVNYYGTSITIPEEHANSITRIRGIQTEAAATYPVSVDNKKKLNLYPGLKVEYIHYSKSGDWSSEYVSYNYYEEWDQYLEIQESGNYDKDRLSGFAFTVLLGFEFKIKHKTSILIEIEKICYHTIKLALDNDYIDTVNREGIITERYRRTIGVETSTYESQQGLIDVGITFGIKIGL